MFLLKQEVKRISIPPPIHAHVEISVCFEAEGCSVATFDNLPILSGVVGCWLEAGVCLFGVGKRREGFLH